MLATNAQRKPTRAYQPVLTVKPFERRSIAILSSEDAALVGPGQHVPEWMRAITFMVRSKAAGLVADGEMRWVGRHKNAATWTAKAAGTWQKTRSGSVHTMQLVVGFKGRQVPAGQRDTLEVGSGA